MEFDQSLRVVGHGAGSAVSDAALGEHENVFVLHQNLRLRMDEARGPSFLPDHGIFVEVGRGHHQLRGEHPRRRENDGAGRLQNAAILGPECFHRDDLIPLCPRASIRKVRANQVHRLVGYFSHSGHRFTQHQANGIIAQSETLLDDRPVGRLTLDDQRRTPMGQRRRARRARTAEGVQNDIAGIGTRQHHALDHHLRERARMIGALLGRAVDLSDCPDVRGVRAFGIVALVSRRRRATNGVEVERRVDDLGTTATALQHSRLHQIEPPLRARRKTLGGVLLGAAIPDDLLNESQAGSGDQREQIVGERHAAGVGYSQMFVMPMD